VFVAVLDPLDQVDAVTGLEPDIDNGKVGLGLGDQLKGLTHVGGLAADLQVPLHSDPQSQRLAHRWVIINQ
jgi:hypothetical protein